MLTIVENIRGGDHHIRYLGVLSYLGVQDPGHIYLFYKEAQCIVSTCKEDFSPQDRLYFHQALWLFIYFTNFPHKNIYLKKAPAPQ